MLLQLSEPFYSALLLALPSDHEMAALRRRSVSAFPRTQTTSGTLAPTCNSSPHRSQRAFPIAIREATRREKTDLLTCKGVPQRRHDLLRGFLAPRPREDQRVERVSDFCSRRWRVRSCRTICVCRL